MIHGLSKSQFSWIKSIVEPNARLFKAALEFKTIQCLFKNSKLFKLFKNLRFTTKRHFYLNIFHNSPSLQIQITNESHNVTKVATIQRYWFFLSSSSLHQTRQVTLRQFSLSSNVLVHVNKRRALVSKIHDGIRIRNFQRNLYIFIIRDS